MEFTLLCKIRVQQSMYYSTVQCLNAGTFNSKQRIACHKFYAYVQRE